MRSKCVILALTLLVLITSACQTPTATTATPDALGATTAPNPPTDQPEQTSEAEQTQSPVVIDITMAPLGTAVTAAVTEDPLAGTTFDSIIFEQSGGLSQTTLVVEVYSDGRVIRDGVTSTISAEEVTALDSLLKSVNFFGIQGQFTALGQNEDDYYFKITVEQAGASRMINAQDGYTPDVLMNLFNTISVLGSGAPS